MAYGYKSIPFEIALTEQMKAVNAKCNEGSPTSLNTVRTLEAMITGYLERDERYNREKKALSETYQKRIDEMRQSQTDGMLTSVTFSQESKQADVDYAIDLYASINSTMVRVGIHPARQATEEEMFEFVPDATESTTATNKV
jgi:hypothetical protein